MKTHFDRDWGFAALVAALIIGAAAPCRAVTAAEVFKAHEAEIATNRLFAVNGYIFGVGRALSRQGGDGAGFSKARLLAQGKILDHAARIAPWPEGLAPQAKALAMRLLKEEGLEIAGLETIFERRETPEHYLAVVAVTEPALQQALPSRESLAALAAKAVARLEEARRQGAPVPHEPRRRDEPGTIVEYEPRGYWEESGVKANETLSEAQFL